eukprot:TRINITY_DN27939_c0_g1_i1.p1 TRINITY_DN27939_c0_g1~~TRINITY_DN27939_c0_g1_i1.p1  ORF type:complete len:457 (+),score=64.47 TRINITY_DN27939_c0_g1_i1:239-1609(+)
MSELNIGLRNAVSSEELCTCVIGEDRTLDELIKVASAALRRLGQRWKLLYNGEHLTGGEELVKDRGIVDGTVLEAVVKSLPPHFLQVASLIRVGYYDTEAWLAQLSSERQNNCLLSWQRESNSARGVVSYFPIGNSSSFEVVVIDTLACVPDDWERMLEEQRGFDEGPRISYAPELMVLQGVDSWNLILGVHKTYPLFQVIEDDPQLYNSSLYTDTINVRDELNKVTCLWWSSLHTCRVLFSQGFFVDNVFVAFARAISNRQLLLVRGRFITDGFGLEHLRFDVWKPVASNTWPSLASVQHDIFKCLGTDLDRRWLWIETRSGINLLNIDSFDFVTCWTRSPSNTSIVHSVLDPVSLDIFLCVDTRQEVEHNVEFYRLQATAGSNLADWVPVSYNDLPELIGTATFGVDVHTGSFCITEAGYDHDRDCILAWDAGRGLWMMPLSQARMCRGPAFAL